MAAVFFLISPTLVCYGRATRITGEDQCKEILYGPGAPDKQVGFVIRARTSNPQWANAQSLDHANAIDSIKKAFFTPENQRGCQAIMLVNGDPSITLSAYRLLFEQLKNKTQNLQQAGGNASSGGTTNLVSKNFNSQLFSIASEYGGITQSTSGQTTTFGGSLSGIPLAIEGSTGFPVLPECSASTSTNCLSSKLLVDGLSRFSFSVGVNSSGGTAGSGTASGGQGTTQPVVLSSASSASNYSLNQVTAKVAILRKMPTASDLSTAVGKLDQTALSKIAMDKPDKDLQTYLKALYGSADPNVNNALASAYEALLNGDAKTEDFAWRDAARQFATAASIAAVHNIGANYKETVAAYLQAAAERSAQEDTVYTAAIKPTLSVEYDLNTPANQPTNSVFKVIGAWVPGNWTLTLNGAASIYNSQPAPSIPSASRIRDFQLAAEADYKLSKSWPIVGQPTLSGAFYYQDQTSPSILKVPISGLPITGLSSSTNQVFTQRGPIDIGQFKISFGKSSSGFSVPLSMTVANRTELLTGMDVRGQIGISYDFSSLLSK
jgi:hypothetical protein